VYLKEHKLNYETYAVELELVWVHLVPSTVLFKLSCKNLRCWSDTIWLVLIGFYFCFLFNAKCCI